MRKVTVRVSVVCEGLEFWLTPHRWEPTSDAAHLRTFFVDVRKHCGDMTLELPDPAGIEEIILRLAPFAPETLHMTTEEMQACLPGVYSFALSGYA